MISEQDLRLLEGDIDATVEGDTLCIETDVARELIRGYRFGGEVLTWAQGSVCVKAPRGGCLCPQEIINIFKGDHEGPDDGDELYPEPNR